MLRSLMRALLAAVMAFVGVLHFARPEFFVRIVPDWLPAHLLLVQISGFFEVLGGVGLLVPKARRAASFGLMALYVAVFPANLNMVIHPELGDGIAPLALVGTAAPAGRVDCPRLVGRKAFGAKRSSRQMG
jgi:uncharacterized membrane protein